MRLYLVLLLAPLASAKLGGDINCTASGLNECMNLPGCTWFENPWVNLNGCRDWNWNDWCINFPSKPETGPGCNFAVLYYKKDDKVVRKTCKIAEPSDRCGTPTY
mmetsp:Transcript_11098/g.20595  ORF Transcript_11098/g.20595 Transcript_11098/m.20595 type:complete len:105 (+) Transcript_11098:152-466(+)